MPSPAKLEENMFKHEKLDDATKHVRLLRFVPSDNVEIRLSLHTYTLDEAPQYNSVSYTWGEPGNERAVVIDGRRFYVRQNCFNALQQVRQHYSDFHVWIDSICINQIDLQEKSQQVQLIWQIYSQAQFVLSCIGEHRDDSELLLPFSEELKSVDYPLPLYRNSKSRWTEWLPSVGEERLKRLTSAYNSFSERRYWRRLWVVQELAVKMDQEDPHVRILCGNDIIPWSRINLLNTILGLVVVQLKDRGLMSEVPGTLSSRLRTLVLFLGDNHELGDAISLFGGFDCADPHDRLYGLLHLSEKGKHLSRIVPDYSISIFELAKVACELSWYRNIDGVLLKFDIDYRSPEVKALVNRRSSRTQKELANPRNTVTKLMDFKGHIEKDKGHESYVTLCSGDTGVLKAPLQENGERWSNEPANSELKRLYKALENTPHSYPEFQDRQPIQLHSEDGVFAGVLCAESRPGDIIVPVYCGMYGVLLVMRQQKGSLYDVIGQGLIWDRYRIPDDPGSSGTCAKIDLRLNTDDMVIIFGQDATNTYPTDDTTFLTEDSGWPIYDPESRLKRLITKPIEDPLGAATVLKWDWPTFSPLPDEDSD